MPRKTSTSKTAGAKASKVQKAKAPRRSHSHFTSVSDALLVRDSRPSSIEWNEAKSKKAGWDVYTVRDGNGKIVGHRDSMSSARRLRYKTDAAAKFAPSAKQLDALRAKKAKADAKASK